MFIDSVTDAQLPILVNATSKQSAILEQENGVELACSNQLHFSAFEIIKVYSAGVLVEYFLSVTLLLALESQLVARGFAQPIGLAFD